MAYNRWLSSQYSYSPGYDLMHYGRKGMKWGKHIFGLPEINLNGGGGSAVDLEELKKLLAQGKITYDEFKSRLAKEWQSTVDANKKGFNQVQDKFSEFYKSLADTYDNFKAGDSADKKPDKRSYDIVMESAAFRRKKKYDQTDSYNEKKNNNVWIRGVDGSKRTDWELDKEMQERENAEKRSKSNSRREKEDTARVNSKLQARKGQNARDAAENERNRLKDLASKPTTPRKAASSNSQRQTTRTPNQNRSDDSSALADLIRVALSSSTSTSTTTSNQAQAQKKPASNPTTTNKQTQSQKEQASENYDFGAKQKKIYSTIAKYLGMLIHASSPSNAMRKSLKYAIKPR